MSRPTTQDLARREQHIVRVLIGLAVLVLAFVLYALVASASASSPQGRSSDATLPNPMGGPALTAPGDASGEVTIDGLEVSGVEVAMGEVALGVTYVPDWTVSNTTDQPVTLVVGQPRVIEGCCPGPVYVDGELVEAGQQLTVPPGGELLLQFPLQMHPGMDGPHHLAIPLASGGEQTAVHVTGDFTASAEA